MKNIKSTDPRKKKIVEEFKRRFSCGKVTLTREDSEFFYGNCQIYNKEKWCYDQLGTQKIRKNEIFFSIKNQSRPVIEHECEICGKPMNQHHFDSDEQIMKCV